MLHEDLNYPWSLEDLARRMRRYAKLASAAEFKNRYRFKVLGGYTFEFVGNWAGIFAAHYGFHVEIAQSGWGPALHEAATLDHSDLNADSYLCFNHPQDLRSHVADDGAVNVDAMKAQFTDLANRIADAGKELIFVLYDASGTVLPATAPATSPAYAMALLNAHMIELAAGRSNVRILDLSVLRAALPSLPFYDQRNWYSFGQPLTLEASILVGHQLAAIARGSLGGSKKVLVLDLDNTLWGGVIGDDGVANLELGEETARGRVHAAIQGLALHLKRRGVVLATASRNNADLALAGFAHPASVLHSDDFAVHEIHWNSKAGSLAAIATAINVGLDSLVFLDDNPAERAEIATVLPDVLVPDIGEDPADFLTALTLLDPFDVTRPLTAEDRVRAEAYSVERQRQEESAKAFSREDFQRSLNTVVDISAPTPDQFPRVVQLINKTNQFNLTTQRLTESEVRSYLSTPDHKIWAANIHDKFGSHGLTSVVLFRHAGDHAHIENWVMSCRVFNKTAEHAIAAELTDYLSRKKVKTLSVTIIPSKKNQVISDLPARLGFSEAGVDSETGAIHWVLHLTPGAAERIAHYCEVRTSD